VSVRYQDVWLQLITQGSKRQLQSIAPQERAALEETDFYIFTMGPRSPIPWSSVPAEKRGEVSVYLDARYDRSLFARRWAMIAKAHNVKMLAVEATLATPERAEAQGLNPEEWRSVMLQGSVADHKTIARLARKLAGVMSSRGSASLSAATGTRLKFDLDSRPVDISDGISTDDMAKKARVVFLPTGVIEVSIDEKSAEGEIVYGVPIRLGNEIVEGLVIELKDGLITKYSATRGLKSFGRYLKEGRRNAGRFSYFGLGLNPNLKRGFTQDDKVLGGLTLGFGDNRSISGLNSAAGQWWASISGATLEVNGRALLDKGSLSI
jgi:leucyl aminopeptidase (aminopeptidase T)